MNMHNLCKSAWGQYASIYLDPVRSQDQQKKIYEMKRINSVLALNRNEQSCGEFYCQNLSEYRSMSVN